MSGSLSSDPDAALQRVLAENDAWAQELFEANRFAAQLAIERQTIADELATVRERERSAANEEAARHIDAAHRERDQAFAERDRALQECDRVRIAHDNAMAMLDRVTSSTAWRVTGPARRIVAALLGRPM